MSIVVIIVSVLGLFAALGSGMAIYKVYDRRRKEYHAIDELSSKLNTWVDDCLDELSNFRATHLPDLEIAAQNEINACIEKHKQLASANIDRLMDGDFYLKAAKSNAPVEGWKNEYETATRNIESNLIDREAINSDLQEVNRKIKAKIREDLLAVLAKVKSSNLNLSEETRKILNELKTNPSDRFQLLGEESEFKNIVDHLDIEKAKGEVWLSLATVGTGISGLVILEVLEFDMVKEVIGSIIKDTMGAEIAQQFSMEIMNWLIQEVGEEIVMEFMEACVIALTGIGAIITLFKVVKYWKLYNRLFIQKEPLEDMKNAARASVAQSLDAVGVSVYETLQNSIDSWLQDLQNNLIESREHMKQDLLVYQGKTPTFASA